MKKFFFPYLFSLCFIFGFFNCNNPVVDDICTITSEICFYANQICEAYSLKASQSLSPTDLRKEINFASQNLQDLSRRLYLLEQNLSASNKQTYISELTKIRNNLIQTFHKLRKEE